MKIMKAKRSSENRLKLAENEQTGFPSPANDHLEHSLSLDELIVQRPSSTFYVRAEGTGMESSGIKDGDLLVVDRSIHPSDGQVVVVAIEDDCLIRKFVKRGSYVYLISDHPEQAPIRIDREMNWIVWGPVTHVIRNMNPSS